MQPVIERGGEQVGVAARSSGPEQGRAACARCGFGVRDGRRQRSARGLGRRSSGGDDGDRRERELLGDPGDLPVPREGETTEERGSQVVGVRLERQPGRQQLLALAASGAAATSPSAIAAAEEPSPRSSGIRLTKRKRFPAGSASKRVGANGEVVGVRRELRAPSPSTATPEPSVTSSSFQRSKATAAVSKAAPMLAEVAGARTIIETCGSTFYSAASVLRPRSRLDRRRPARAPARSGLRSRCPSSRGR